LLHSQGDIRGLAMFLCEPTTFEWFTSSYPRKIEMMRYWKACTSASIDIASILAGCMLEVALELNARSIDEVEKDLNLLHSAGKFLREVASYPASELILKYVELKCMIALLYSLNLIIGPCTIIAQGDILPTTRIRRLPLLQLQMPLRTFSEWPVSTLRPNHFTLRPCPSASG
jgi:hypothetical protein